MMPIEQVYGVVVVIKEEKENKFLLLKHADTKDDNWSFPKGHTKDGETPKETMLRELEEETGIKEIKLLDFPLIREAYEIFHHDEKRLKVNEYFIGFVKDDNVKIDGEEICSYKWASFEEALGTFSYGDRKQVLKKAKEYLETL